MVGLILKIEKENIDKSYKLKVLSEYKVQVEYLVPIFAVSDGYVTIIGKVKFKTKYRIDKDERRHSGELPTYHFIRSQTDRFLQLLSQKWEIKMKHILLHKENEFINIDGFQIKGIYTGVIFDDQSWTRDWQIKKILEDAK
jgi:hypothetical protein